MELGVVLASFATREDGTAERVTFELNTDFSTKGLSAGAGWRDAAVAHVTNKQEGS